MIRLCSAADTVFVPQAAHAACWHYRGVHGHLFQHPVEGRRTYYCADHSSTTRWCAYTIYMGPNTSVINVMIQVMTLVYVAVVAPSELD